MTLAIVLGIGFLCALWLCLGLGEAAARGDEQIERLGREPQSSSRTARSSVTNPPSRPAPILSDDFWDELQERTAEPGFVWGHRLK